MALGEGLSLSQDSAAPPAIVEGYASSAGSDLAGRVAHDFQMSSAARLFQEQQIFIRALFNSRAFYMPGFNFTSSSSQAFVNATRPKLQTALALLMPIICPPGQEAFTISPDPETVDPEEAYELLKTGMPIDQIRDTLFQKAGSKADRLNSKIKRASDYIQLNDKHLRYLWDLSLFGTGIMMGPTIIKNPEIENDDDTDAMDPIHEGPVDKIKSIFSGMVHKIVAGPEKQLDLKDKIKKMIKLGLIDEYLPQVDVISPLDFYPDPAGMTVEQMRYFIWRMTLGKGQVMEMLDDESFRHEAVEEVLENYPNGVWQPTYWETAVNALNHQPQQSVPNGRYICLQWWGYLTGKDLAELGAHEIPKDRFKERVIAQIWTIGGKIVKVAVSDLHTNRLPVYVTPYSIAPNSIWGIGPAEMMFDSQDAINACERSLMDNMGLCLTGDTVVYRHERPGRSSKRRHNQKGLVSVTLNQLWEQKHKKNSGLRRNIIRSLDESTGKFFGNRIVDILNNGFKSVYRMTTEAGYTIKGTIDHRFLADDGNYRKMGQFAIGDMIGVNGSSAARELVCMDCSKSTSKPGALRCKSCAAKVNRWNIEQAERAVFNKDANPQTARQRRLVQDQKKEVCEACGSDREREVHHLDKNPMNCDPSNLMTLCIPCHNDWHARHDHYGDPVLHAFLDYDKIISVEYVGEEEVFDLVMTAPNHNFVANGFVAHNCAGPQVVVDLELLADPTNVLEIKPRKIWAIRGKVGVNSKPIDFFVPECRLDNILAVQRNEERLSQEQTGLPNFLQGMQGDGVHNRTLGGASLQFNNAVSSLKTVAYNIENNQTIPMVQKLIHFFQQTSNDPSIKGRFMVTAHGVRGLLAKESLIEAMGILMQNIGNIPEAQDRIKWANFFKSYMRYGSLANEDLTYSDSEYQQNQEKKRQQAMEDKAMGAGIESAPKLRAEMPAKDAIIELVKSADEGSSVHTALLQEAAKIWGFMTPELQKAFEAQAQISNFQELNQAHALGSEMGDRAHQPIPNVLGDHPHLLPQPAGGK